MPIPLKMTLEMRVLLDGVLRGILWHSRACQALVTLMLLPFGMATWGRYRLVEPGAQVGQEKDCNIRGELLMGRTPRHL